MKTYWLKFGSGDPSNFAGLSPTFITFSAYGLTALAAPGVSEMPTGSGLYRFDYGPTLPIIFTADGGSALSSGDRFITGTLDPIQAVDEKIGTVSDSFGSTLTDPSTVLGYLKRSQEFQEGDADFQKSTGVWSVSTRGSSTLLFQKTLANNATEATKE